MTSNVQVKFYSLVPTIVLPDEVYTVPVDSSVYDLNEIISSLTEYHMQFDFFIYEMLVASNLGYFLKQNNITAEETILIQCAISPKIPSLVASANTPDWISRLCVYEDRILAANYDGSLQVIEQKDREIYVVDAKLLSTHALKHIYLFEAGIAVSGEAGSVKIMKDLNCTEMCEFKLEQVPVLNMGLFCNSLFVYTENCKLQLIAADKAEFEPCQVKKGVLRGKQCTTDLVFDLSELHPANVFQGTENLFLSLDNNVLDCYNILEEKHILKIPGPAMVGDMFYVENYVLVGYMDRAVRLFDVRAGSMVYRSYLGHKSHIYRLCYKNEYQFFSADVSGVVYLWDLRASRPYHKIDCYDYEIDKRNDQGRVLDCVCSGDNLYVGGSARKLFWYDV